MLLANPSADIPIIQLSVLRSEDPSTHHAMGKALISCVKAVWPLFALVSPVYMTWISYFVVKHIRRNLKNVKPRGTMHWKKLWRNKLNLREQASLSNGGTFQTPTKCTQKTEVSISCHFLFVLEPLDTANLRVTRIISGKSVFGPTTGNRWWGCRPVEDRAKYSIQNPFECAISCVDPRNVNPHCCDLVVEFKFYGAVLFTSLFNILQPASHNIGLIIAENEPAEVTYLSYRMRVFLSICVPKSISWAPFPSIVFLAQGSIC